MSAFPITIILCLQLMTLQGSFWRASRNILPHSAPALLIPSQKPKTVVIDVTESPMERPKVWSETFLPWETKTTYTQISIRN